MASTRDAQRQLQHLAALVDEHWRRFSALFRAELSAAGLDVLAGWMGALCAIDEPPQTVRLLRGVLRGEPVDQPLSSLARRLAQAGLGHEAVAGASAAFSQAFLRLLTELGETDPEVLLLAAEQVGRGTAQVHAVVEAMRADTASAEAERAQLLWESVGEGLLVLDGATGQVLEANAAAEDLTGYSRRQLRWLALADLLPEVAEVRWQELMAADDDAPPMRFECRLMGRGGNQPLVRVSAGKLTHGGRTLVHLAMGDITDQVRLTERLAELAGALRRRLEDQMRELDEQRQFLANVLDALPLRLIVLDENLAIVHANAAYYRERNTPMGDVTGRHLADLFPRELMEDAGLESAIRSTFQTGDPVRWAGYRAATPDHPERVVDIRLDPCGRPSGEKFVLLTIEDVTLRQQQLYERTLLQQVTTVMLEANDLPRLLYAILTAMTAGGACGLGLNRAFLLLADEEAGVLRGEMAVGPASAEEAYCIWAQVASRYRTIADFMEEYDEAPPDRGSPLGELVAKMTFPMRDVERLPMLAVTRGGAVHITHASADPRVPAELRELLGVEEFVVAPLLVSDKVIGVAIADNFVTGKPIGEDDVNLLTSLANHAALALDSARARELERQRAEELRQAYEELARTQQQLVRSKQLAAIGEVAAIVAHEIRNPLSTIGGFARHLVRWPSDTDRVERNSRIILEEVERLEGILNDLLEFSRPRELVRRPTDLAALTEELAEMMRTSPFAEEVEVRVEREPDLPLVLLDQTQFRQVINNLMRNGVEAMPQGGVLTLRLSRHKGGVALAVADTGMGIPKERLSAIFDAFVTSKPTGTGLGLALSRAIVRQHDAQLTVESEPSKGTVFTVWFPPESCVAREEAVTDATRGSQMQD